jgi:putative tricarboxylic transport membrane protein
MVILMTQRNRDVISSIFCIGVGIIFCAGSIKYGDIRAGFPNAGFFPFMGGGVLILLSSIQLFGIFRTDRKAQEDKSEAFFPQHDSLKRIMITLAILFFYCVALVYVGFLIATFLFMVLLLRCIEPQRWTVILITAFLTSICSYILFEILLKAQFPRGILWNS